MTTVRWFVAALLVGTAPVWAAAAPVERPLDLFDLGAPSFTSFSSRDGVPESVVTAARADPRGFVWLASPLGLASYDGRRWSALEREGLAGVSMRDLTLDHAGTLWAALTEHGLARYDGRQWTVQYQDAALPTDRLRRVMETFDSAGRPELWALPLAGPLLRRVGERWVAEPGCDQLPAGPLLAIAHTHALGGHERLWVGTFNEGVWYREDGVWRRLQSPGFDPAQVEYLLATEHEGHEELWIATYGSGLARLDASGLRVWSMASGELPTDELYVLAQTSLPNGDRAIWVASRSGLIRVYGDRAQVFDRRHGLPSNVIRGVSAWRSPDGVDVLWVATESGVARGIVGGSQWRTASLMGAGSSGVFAVLVEPDGKGGERLWITSSADGVGLYEQGRWRQFSQAGGFLPDADARMLVRVPDEHGGSTLWLGERSGWLLRVREGPRFEVVPTPWERHPGQAVMDLVTREEGGRREHWFATRQSGVYRWREGIWTAFRPENAVGQWRIVKLAEQIDAGGRSWLWASSNLGLARFDGERWVLFGADIGLPADLRGMSLFVDAAGRQVLWVGTTANGQQRVDVTDPARPRMLKARPLPPPPDATTYGAVRDSHGRIYVCTNDGVQLLTPAGDGYTSRVFRRRDGMVHEECNTNAQFIDAHDRFWTGTLGGLAVFDPENDIVDRHAKPLRLTGVAIDGKAADPTNVRARPGARDLRIDYALLSWQREDESRFRTQLLGYETRPSEWTPQAFRIFNGLGPGTYTLRIEARDYGGLESAPIELPIEIVPEWWQRGWSQAAFATLALLGAYAVIVGRTRSLEGQRRHLEETVAQRTRELHDANARLLELSYKDALTGLANRRWLLAALEPAPENAVPDAVPGTPPADGPPRTALVFVDVDHFKEYNDLHGHPAGDEALRAVAGVLRACAPPGVLVARYGGEEFACLLGDADRTQAIAFAERIRIAVADRDVPVPGTGLVRRVTISAGVASARLATAADAHRLLRDADAALYQAKRAGRNCVRG